MGPTAVFTCFVRDVAPPYTVLWGPDLILSRRPFWRLAHIKKVRPGQGPGAQQKEIRDKIALFFTPVLRLEPTSTSWLRDPFTAVLEALHMNVMT